MADLNQHAALFGEAAKGPIPGANRTRSIAAGLTRVRDRIATAADAAGRSADEVTLVVVTKFFPVSDVRILADLGVCEVGENRHQEAAAKASECADLRLRWHFIGGLQSNKAAAVAAYADVIESVDRPKLVAPLSRGAIARGETARGPVDVLLQVALDPPGRHGRSGVDPDRLLELAQLVADAEGLRLRGLMAVAPLGEEPNLAFARLAQLRERFLNEHPSATTLSAGMSADLEAAIAHGATHVRVGSAVLGARPEIK